MQYSAESAYAQCAQDVFFGTLVKLVVHVDYTIHYVFIVKVNAILLTAHVRQFDTMMYPEKKNKGTLTGIVEFFTGSGPDHARFDVPQPYKMRLQSMKIHLEQYKAVLLRGQFESKFDIPKAVGIINDIYQCSARQYCGISGSNVNHWEFSNLLNNVSTTIMMTDMLVKLFTPTGN